VQAAEACDVEEPCAGERSYTQLVESRFHHINSTPSCLFSALAERRPGRYLHDTDSTFSSGTVGALHHLVVGADGTVAYVREPYRNVSNVGELPPVEPLRCILKPPSYFEACRAAVEALMVPDDSATSPVDDEAAWSCTFGDGAIITPSNLPWFESCASETQLRCE
jgi:hypothetical protein